MMDFLELIKNGLCKSVRLRIGVIGLAILLIMLISYYTGKLIANSAESDLKNAKSQTVQTIKNELENTKTQLTLLENTNKVNIQSIEQTRQTILQLEQQIYSQQKEIISYKAIIAKKKTTTSLVFRDFIIQATEQPNAYRYKLILTRADQAKQILKGTLNIAIEGTLNNKPKSLILADITQTDSHTELLSFSFQYMEMIPPKNQFGELVLPENFKPKSVKITAYLSDNAKQPITHVFNWSVIPLPIPDVIETTD